jgi:ABC-type thiamin/hydroxymethylpyrimidine transport system permease subunit
VNHAQHDRAPVSRAPTQRNNSTLLRGRMHRTFRCVTYRREESPMVKMLAGCMTLLAAFWSPVHAAGNGAQSGPHYNLNLLGKNDCSPAP